MAALSGLPAGNLCTAGQPLPCPEATAAGAVGIAKASLVTGNPYIIVGGALLAVGVAAGVESGAFENLVDNAVSYLDSAGSWITDGSMQLLQTVTEAGNAALVIVPLSPFHKLFYVESHGL